MNGLDKPFGKRPRQAVPGFHDKPRVLDEHRVRGISQRLAGGEGFGGSDLGHVEGLYLGHVRGCSLQLEAQDFRRLAAFVFARGYEDSPHVAEVYNRCMLCGRVAPVAHGPRTL